MPGRATLRALAALVVLLALAAATAFQWTDRQHEIDLASAQVQRGAERLADDLQTALNLGELVLQRLEGKLNAQDDGGHSHPGRSLQQALDDIHPLLAGLPLPMTVQALAADGRVLGGLSDAGDVAQVTPLPQRPGWQVGVPQGPQGAMQLPLLRQAGAGRHGVAAWRVLLDHGALMRRLQASHTRDGGGAALVRIEADGSNVVLARVPSTPAELGRRVRGPLSESLAQAPKGLFQAVVQLDQVERLVAYQRLHAGANALVVTNGVALQSVLAPWWTGLPWAVVATLLLAAAIALGGWRLDRALWLQSAHMTALQRSEGQFRALAGNLPDVVVRFDREGRHLYANPAAQSATGMPPEAFIGKTNAELGMPAENVAVWLAALGQAFKTGHSQRLEFSYPGPQGLRHWESLITPEPVLRGEPPTALVISRDISERKQAEAALRQSEQRFRLASASGQVWEWDFDAGGVAAPDEFFEALGLPAVAPEQVLASFEAVLHPDDLAEMRRQAVRHFKGQAPYRLEFRARDAQGRWRWFDTKGQALFDQHGRAVYMAGTTFEVTARREAEHKVRQLAAELEQRVAERTEQLAQSEASLRQVNRELETFTYSVSHDLKAPLRGIDGYSRLLMADHGAGLNDEGREFIGHIRQATQQMGELIDDLLAYSRLERRELTLASQPLGLLVQGVVAGFGNEMAAGGVVLALQIGPELQVRADAQGLVMALRNLVDNALKFSLAAAPPQITISATPVGAVVQLSVHDNGVGFDMKFHDRIFQIFQRLHRAEHYPGTGVGLAIARKAMDRMGGRIWAASHAGQGATFTIELPLAGTP